MHASDKRNYLCNAYENLLKARNKNCVSVIGAREGMTALICSNRNKVTSTIMNKQGAKGSIGVLKNIIQNTVTKYEFKAPSDCMCNNCVFFLKILPIKDSMLNFFTFI